MEQYSYYKFEVTQASEGFIYRIQGTGCMPYDDGIIESNEWFDTEEEAHDAAKNHIDLLESGESL